MILGRLVIGLLIYLMVLTVSAGVFKCTSADGKTVYSEKPCSGKEETFLLKKNNAATGASVNARSTNSSSTANLAPEVDIYVTSWCPYCKKAMNYLDAQGIDYNRHDIERDPIAAETKRQLAPGYSGIPLTVINGEVIRGFSEAKFQRALSN